MTKRGKCHGCGMPYTDESMVCCDACQLWVHFECAGVDDSVAERPWKCDRCGGPPIKVNVVTRVANEFQQNQGRTALLNEAAGGDDDPEGSLNLEQQKQLVQAFKETRDREVNLEKAMLVQEKAFQRSLQQFREETELKLEEANQQREYELSALRRMCNVEAPVNKPKPKLFDDFEGLLKFNDRQSLKDSASEHKKSSSGSDHSRLTAVEAKVDALGGKFEKIVADIKSSPPSHEAGMGALVKMMKRQTLEALPKFSGANRKEWFVFQAVYEGSREEATDEKGEIDKKALMKLLRAAVQGEARDLVIGKLTLGQDPDDVMQTLAKVYGKAKELLASLADELTKHPKLSGLKDPKFKGFAVSLQTYVEQMKMMGKKAQLNSDHLEVAFLRTFENVPSVATKWNVRKKANPDLDLEAFSNFVMEQWEALPTITIDQKAQVSDKSKTSKAVMYQQPVLDPADCSLCAAQGQTEAHFLFKCRRFLEMSISQRWEYARQERLCLGCLRGSEHQLAECPFKRKCAHCPKFHSRLLCSKGERPRGNYQSGGRPNRAGQASNHSPQLNAQAAVFQRSSNAASGNTAASFSVPHHSVQHHNSEDFSLTGKVVKVRVYGRDGAFVDTYAFLDDGSTLTMMERDIYDQLGLEGEHDELSIRWTQGIERTEDAMRCDVTISGATMKQRFTLSNVCCVKNLSLVRMSQNGSELAQRYSHLRGLPLPTFNGVQPGILIGLEHANLLSGPKVIEGQWGEPIASKTRLGWVVFGRQVQACSQHTAGNARRQEVLNFHMRLPKCCDNSDRELHELVKSFFAGESVDSERKSMRSVDDERAERIMETTLKYNEGKYAVGLLWKSDHEHLPDNSKMAMRRLMSEEKKLAKDPDSLKWMNEHVQSLLEKQYARKATQSDLTGQWERTWFCPLFMVVNRNKLPPKRRCVADVAATEGGVSLNSCLLKGPDNMIALPAALCRARQHAVMVNADVREMFHRIDIIEEDQQCQRFLWRNGNSNVKPEVFVMNAMMFGPTCSPSQAQHIKNFHAEKYRSECPKAVDALQQNMFVDDLFFSCASPQEAVSVSRDAIAICKSMNFDLVQFQSNSQEVLNQLPKQNVNEVLVSVNLEETTTYVRKVLGMFWMPSKDVFIFKQVADDLIAKMLSGYAPTKREVTSSLMRYYDPLGMAAKYLVRGKWILQDVWRAATDWDEQISPELATEWLSFLKAFEQLESVEIPRWYAPVDPTRCDVTLVVFVDASDKASAAVAYFVFADDGEHFVSLVMAKTKVAPIKTMSIPRLELEAARLGVKVCKQVEAHQTFAVARRIFLSDSKCVLAWINTTTFKLPTFVAHRVSEIREATAVSEWFYVPSEENVADDATKVTAQSAEGAGSRWFVGAKFLSRPIAEWPIEPVKTTESAEAPAHAVLYHEMTHEHPIQRIAPRFKSSWKKLARMVAVMNRFVAIVTRQKKGGALPLTEEELKQAEVDIFRFVQQAAYPEMFKDSAIKAPSGDMTRSPADTKGLALQMNEKENVIRLRSRDRTSASSYSAKNPILLPKEHEFVRLYLQHVHSSNRHMGVESIIAEARQEVWIVAIRQALRGVMSRCQFCKNRRAAPEMPTMGMLHESRTAFDQKPFSYVGVDCFGPIAVKERRSEVKRWGVIFTCLTYRAVHLELVQDLSADAMVLAARRLLARRGPIKMMFSDNGTNFVGADGVIKQQELERVQRQLAHQVTAALHVTWRFIPAYSPWMGGAWERLIGYVKACIKHCLEGETPHEAVLNNALIEAELIANKRPLTHSPIDPDDDEPLTPNLALFGASDSAQAIGPHEQRDQYSRMGRKRVAHLVEKFRKRWEREYLPVIARAEGGKPRKAIELGDIVLIAEGNENRDNWRMARVCKIYPSNDLIPRIVDVKLPSGEVKTRRAVANLAVLDLGESPPRERDLSTGGNLSHSQHDEQDKMIS